MWTTLRCDPRVRTRGGSAKLRYILYNSNKICTSCLSFYVQDISIERPNISIFLQCSICSPQKIWFKFWFKATQRTIPITQLHRYCCCCWYCLINATNSEFGRIHPSKSASLLNEIENTITMHWSVIQNIITMQTSCPFSHRTLLGGTD